MVALVVMLVVLRVLRLSMPYCGDNVYDFWLLIKKRMDIDGWCMLLPLNH
jgi:hypothetical protein